MQKVCKNKGFTLVEMAIVLVIVGLVVVAIFQGDELLDAYRIQKTSTQLANFRSAIALFKDKYGFYPGDVPSSARFFPGIGTSANYCDSPAGYTGNDILDHGTERMCFWPELSRANFIKEHLVTGAIQSPGVTTHRGVFEGSGYLASGLQLNLGLPGLAGDSYYRRKVATAATAYRLDLKIDDGKPYVGSVQGRNGYGETGCVNTTGGAINNRVYTPLTTTETICYFELYDLF